MSFEKMKLTEEQVLAFQTNRSDEPVRGVVALSGGNWSQAFAFKQGDNELVARFGMHQKDYLVDQYTSHFSSVNLPIPEVLEVGEAFDGYYAISRKAGGIMFDDLDKSDMRRIVPSLLETLDGIREADVSDSSGYGWLDEKGQGTYPTWEAYLLSIYGDRTDSKIVGWRSKLASSPLGEEPFEQAYARLSELCKDLPKVRALIHSDLVNFNVLTNNGHITAVFDWANAMYGDFLYDLANFTFWAPMHEPIKGIDWEAEALDHFNEIGLSVPEFDRRLQCYMIHYGLDSMAYHAYKQNWEMFEQVTNRTLEIAKSE